MIELLTRNTDVIIAAMAALSVFSGCMVLLWPYFARDTLALRMREVAAERENIRIRERTRLQAGKKASLRTEPKKLFKDIVDRLNLNAQADDGQIVQQLRMAGYRGRAPVITFVAVRLIMPFALFAVATFYVFVVLQLQQAFVLKLGMALAVALLGYYGPALYLKNRVTKRQKAIRRAWPDALDLLLICVESGMSVESAFRKVSEEIG
jgi:tight adherence protein C